MAVAFVSGSYGATAFPGGSVSLPAPASIVSGNLLVAFLSTFGGSSISAPAGWSPSTAPGLPGVFTKVATGAEPGSYTFTNAGSGQLCGTVLQYSGAATTLDGSAVNNGLASGGQPIAPSLTPSHTTDVWAVACHNGGGTVYTVPSGFTQRSSGTNGANCGLVSGDETLASSSPTGTATFGGTGAGGSSWYTGSFLIAATVTGITGTATVAAGPLTVTGSSRVTVGAAGCVRSGWLTLPGRFLALEDPTAGYFCSSLDLGYPTPRDVITNRPDQGGAVDRTQWLGIRTINVQIEALSGAGARVDQVAARFGPYLDPAARPVLHYVLDRDANPERAITVRAAGFAWPIQGPYQRSIQLQFVAADPIAYDPTVRTVTAIPAAPATLTTSGDLPARPLLRVTGPATGPAVTLTPAGGSPWQLNFLASFTVAAGHYVDVDTAARSVLLDGNPAQPRLSSIDWTVSSWQSIPPATATTLAIAGTATSGATQVQAVWNDGYLT